MRSALERQVQTAPARARCEATVVSAQYGHGGRAHGARAGQSCADRAAAGAAGAREDCARDTSELCLSLSAVLGGSAASVAVWVSLSPDGRGAEGRRQAPFVDQMACATAWLVSVAAIVAVMIVLASICAPRELLRQSSFACDVHLHACVVSDVLVYFQSEEDRNTAWAPKIAVILGLTLMCSIVLMLPLDVANRGCNSRLPMELLWQLMCESCVQKQDACGSMRARACARSCACARS